MIDFACWHIWQRSWGRFQGIQEVIVSVIVIFFVIVFSVIIIVKNKFESDNCEVEVLLADCKGNNCHQFHCHSRRCRWHRHHQFTLYTERGSDGFEPTEKFMFMKLQDTSDPLIFKKSIQLHNLPKK